jgi:hypothetical protein
VARRWPGLWRQVHQLTVGLLAPERGRPSKAFPRDGAPPGFTFEESGGRIPPLPSYFARLRGLLLADVDF